MCVCLQLCTQTTELNLLGPQVYNVFVDCFCRWTTLSPWLQSSSSTLLTMKTWILSARSTPKTFPLEVKGTSLPGECLSSWGSTVKTRFTPLLRPHPNPNPHQPHPPKHTVFILSNTAHAQKKKITVFTPFVGFVYTPNPFQPQPHPPPHTSPQIFVGNSLSGCVARRGENQKGANPVIISVSIHTQVIFHQLVWGDVYLYCMTN